MFLYLVITSSNIFWKSSNIDIHSVSLAYVGMIKKCMTDNSRHSRRDAWFNSVVSCAFEMKSRYIARTIAQLEKEMQRHMEEKLTLFKGMCFWSIFSRQFHWKFFRQSLKHHSSMYVSLHITNTVHRSALASQ
mgnify:CR=1 FL=1